MSSGECPHHQHDGVAEWLLRCRKEGFSKDGGGCSEDWGEQPPYKHRHFHQQMQKEGSPHNQGPTHPTRPLPFPPFRQEATDSSTTPGWWTASFHKLLDCSTQTVLCRPDISPPLCPFLPALYSWTLFSFCQVQNYLVNIKCNLRHLHFLSAASTPLLHASLNMFQLRIDIALYHIYFMLFCSVWINLALGIWW